MDGLSRAEGRLCSWRCRGNGLACGEYTINWGDSKWEIVRCLLVCRLPFWRHEFVRRLGVVRGLTVRLEDIGRCAGEQISFLLEPLLYIANSYTISLSKKVRLDTGTSGTISLNSIYVVFKPGGVSPIPSHVLSVRHDLKKPYFHRV